MREDTPKERDEKATTLEEEVKQTAKNLEAETIAEAKRIARQLRGFRWEVRTYYIIVLLFMIKSLT